MDLSRLVVAAIRDESPIGRTGVYLPSGKDRRGAWRGVMRDKLGTANVDGSDGLRSFLTIAAAGAERVIGVMGV